MATSKAIRLHRFKKQIRELESHAVPTSLTALPLFSSLPSMHALYLLFDSFLFFAFLIHARPCFWHALRTPLALHDMGKRRT